MSSNNVRHLCGLDMDTWPVHIMRGPVTRDAQYTTYSFDCPRNYAGSGKSRLILTISNVWRKTE